MDAVPDIPGLAYTQHQWGSHMLMRLGIWQPVSSVDTSPGRWIIFIHGGAWRDPRNTLQDFVPSIKHMTSSSGVPKPGIKGFISLDYRLSPPSASAVHPDHILDIRSALHFLAREYDLKNDYVLVGHSAGATLAFQLLMGQDSLPGHSSPDVPLPAAVVGISGIFDLVGIDARHDGNYTGFITAAFGSDKDAWKSASPASYTGSFKDKWGPSHLALLAWSPEDSLVDEPEVDAMASKLAKDGVNSQTIKDLTGDHDLVWQDGAQVSRLVKEALERL